MQLRFSLKRWLIIGATILAVVILAGIALSRTASPLLREKLQSLARTHLDATLEMADLSYRFPYTIRLRDARLTSNDQRSDGFRTLAVASAVLTLDALPFGEGPLLIRNIELDRPTLQIVRTAPAEQPASTAATAASSRPVLTPVEQRRLSDLFRLRRLVLRAGAVEYEDQTRADLPPMVWSDLSTDLHIDPQSVSRYAYRLTTAAPPLADLSADGTFDIDNLVLSVDRCALSARIDSTASTSPLPAVFSRFIQTYQIGATLKLTGSGRFPMRDLDAGSFASSIDLDDGQLRVPQLEHDITSIAASASITRPANQQQMQIQLEKLAAATSGADMSLSGAAGTIDFAASSWSAQVPSVTARLNGVFPTTSPSALSASAGSVELSASLSGPLAATWSWGECDASATLHQISLHTRVFDSPVNQISGVMKLQDGAVHAQSLQCKYGNDVWVLDRARVPLDSLPDRIEVFDIDGHISFDPPSPQYPLKVGQVIAYLRPANTFTLRGAFVIDPSTQDDRWAVRVGTDEGSFNFTDPEIAIAEVRGQAAISPQLIDIRNISASAFGGALTGSGTIDPRGDVRYGGHLSLEGADVSQMAQAFRLPEASKIKLVGRLDGAASFSSTSAAPESLSGEGELSIHDGELWEAPVLKHVAEQSKAHRESLTASEAAAVFQVADARVHLNRAALYSPALGLEGSGTIGFDGELDLKIVAAPLGDWEKHIKGTNLPLMSNVIGSVAGAMQKVINAATSELLYEFHVTGHVAHPHVEVVPTPVLTDTAAVLFERMLRGQKDLANSIRPPPQPEQR